jgi:hypothetical protein
MGTKGKARARTVSEWSAFVFCLLVFAIPAASHAGDLPAEPAPVDYVRVCDAFGTGYLAIPGTDTCYLINGYFVAEWHVFGSDKASRQPGFYGDQDANVGYTKTNLSWSSVANTEVGLLRATAKYELVDTPTFGGQTGNLKAAYIEFGGLTFGRLQSLFDFITGTTYADIFEPAWSDIQTNVAAYTAAFGSGLSATLSIEDGVYRRVGIIDGGGTRQGLRRRPPARHRRRARTDQQAVQARVMAALHEVRAARRGAGSQMGWTLAAGASLDVPFTGEGDQFMLQASIGQGALSYNATNPIGPGRDFVGADARVLGGRLLVLANVWAVGAVFDHTWTDKWVTELNGSYLDVDQAGRAYDFRNIDAQLNLSYAPVDGLKFTARASTSTSTAPAARTATPSS